MNQLDSPSGALTAPQSPRRQGSTRKSAQRPVPPPLVRPHRLTSGARIELASPSDWVCFGGSYLTPVVDAVSRHLNATCKALDRAEPDSAARQLRGVAAELRRCAVAAAQMDGVPMRATVRLAQNASWRLAASALRANELASAIEAGRIQTRAQLCAPIEGSVCADIERRWLVMSIRVWYPVCCEPLRHFAGADLALARKDATQAGVEIARAMSYLRLEAARAIGSAKVLLEGARTELEAQLRPDGLATDRDRRALGLSFAVACLCLAQAHRGCAYESWLRSDFEKAGYASKAAALSLASVAAWVDDDAESYASQAAEQANALGEELLSGPFPNREAVLRRIEALGLAQRALSTWIGARQASRAGRSAGWDIASARALRKSIDDAEHELPYHDQKSATQDA